MNSMTFQQLQNMRKKFGPGIFGKLAQKLLALAFYDAGFSHVVERGVQGVDIDAANLTGERSYTLEVKTTDGQSVTITKDNIQALKARAKDGYIPVIAALRVQMFEDWLFSSIPLSQLKPGSFPLSRLRAYRITSLEHLLCPAFELVVNEHFKNAFEKGENYLIHVLKQRQEGHT